VEHLLITHGYLAIVLLGFIEACCVPIPSEITVGFAGVLVSEHRLEIVAVIVLGVLAEIAGSLVTFAVGRIGGRPFVERVGRYVLLTSRDLDRAERFFEGRGGFAVLVGRAAPVLRAFVSLAAGIAEMPTGRFVLFGSIGTAIYVTALTCAGDAVGAEWHQLVHGFSLAGYVIVALVVVAVALAVLHRLRDLRRERVASS
jgi:membrane protein DedA with SNARE-associated domain